MTKWLSRPEIDFSLKVVMLRVNVNNLIFLQTLPASVPWLGGTILLYINPGSIHIQNSLSNVLTHLSQQLRFGKGVETISQGLLWFTWPLCNPLNILCSHPSNKTWAPALSLAQCEPESLGPLGSNSRVQIIKADDTVLYIKPFMPTSKWWRKTAVMTMIYHHTPFNEDTPFIEDTSSNTFKVNWRSPDNVERGLEV